MGPKTAVVKERERGRVSRIAVILELAVFFLTLGFALVIPIYGDETAYDYILGRFFRESGSTLFMWPQCESEFSTRVPPLWVPFRAAIGTIYDVMPSPRSLRYLAGFLACVTYGLLFVILRRRASSVSPRVILLFVASINIATFQFLFAMARPEVLLIALGFVAVLLSEYKPTARRQVAITVASLAAASIHPLGVAMAPLFVASLARLSALCWPTCVFVLFTIGASLAGAQWHHQILRCEEDGAIRDYLRYYQGFADLQDWYRPIVSLPAALGRSISLLYHLRVQPRFDWGMLPPLPIGLGAPAEHFSRWCIAVWLVGLVWLFGRATIQSVKDMGARGCNDRADLLIPLGVLGTLLLAVAAQPQPIVYRLCFYVPLFMLLLGWLIFPALDRSQTLFSRRMIASLSAVASLSAFVSIVSYGAGMLVETRLSSEAADAIPVLKSCTGTDLTSARRVVVDAKTYWSLRKTKEPIFIEPLFFESFRDGRPFNFERLKRVGATAIIVSCDIAGYAGLSTKAKRFGALCCMRSEDIELLDTNESALLFMRGRRQGLIWQPEKIAEPLAQVQFHSINDAVASY